MPTITLKNIPPDLYELLKDAHWVALLLWRSEFRNVLAIYLRKQWFSLEASQQIMSGALQLMADHEYEANSDQVLKLVTMNHCSAYAGEFVAPAQELGTTLVTTADAAV
ncbi:MAG: hypothetical protein U0795_04535 [Pirellulales bacterium]